MATRGLGRALLFGGFNERHSKGFQSIAGSEEVGDGVALESMAHPVDSPFSTVGVEIEQDESGIEYALREIISMTHHTDSLGRPMPLDARGLLIPDAAAAQEAEARRQLEAVYRANYTGGPLAIAKTEPAPSSIESAHLERLPPPERELAEAWMDLFELRIPPTAEHRAKASRILEARARALPGGAVGYSINTDGSLGPDEEGSPDFLSATRDIARSS